MLVFNNSITSIIFSYHFCHIVHNNDFRVPHQAALHGPESTATKPRRCDECEPVVGGGYRGVGQSTGIHNAIYFRAVFTRFRNLGWRVHAGAAMAFHQLVGLYRELVVGFNSQPGQSREELSLRLTVTIVTAYVYFMFKV